MKTRKSVQIVENAQLKENLPDFNQGDTVLVQVIVKAVSYTHLTLPTIE